MATNAQAAVTPELVEREDVAPARRAASAAFRTLSPEDFAPFEEAELITLADRLSEAEDGARSTLLAQSAAGATLLGVCGSADQLLESLLSVWGPDGVASLEDRDAFPDEAVSEVVSEAALAGE